MPSNETPHQEVAESARQLVEWLAHHAVPVVAFSGGVDSAVVACAAQRAYPGQAIAVTGHSPSVSERERAIARQVASQIGIQHLELTTHEIDNPQYVANNEDRCFHCKTELYASVWKRIRRQFPNSDVVLLSGANADDWSDHRPGLQAAAEAGVLHPLTELGLGKAAVRELARYWNLPVWNKPASPCLASRIAYGQEVTPQRLKMVEDAEALMHELGWTECRVRYHEGNLARIEVPLETLGKLVTPEVRSIVVRRLRAAGFTDITVDLQGFRTGSLNQLVAPEQLQRWRISTPTSSDSS